MLENFTSMINHSLSHDNFDYFTFKQNGNPIKRIVYDLKPFHVS